MSQPHEVAIVQVSSLQEETIRLADLLGRVPVPELVEVLDADPHWQAVQAGRVYRRQLRREIGMEVRIDASGEVLIRRRISESVTEGSEEAVRLRQEELLRQVEHEYKRVVNELVAHTLVRALPNRAREMGYIVKELPAEARVEEHVVEVVLELA